MRAPEPSPGLRPPAAPPRRPGPPPRGSRPRRAGRRRGGTVVEMAVVCPIVLLLIIGTLVMGLGVFRLQQLEALAREGARWAAVHGPTSQQEHDEAAPTSADVLDRVILPRVVGLDPDELTCSLTMTDGSAILVLRYRWVPEAFFPPIVVERRAVAPITY
ncbi:TadE family protein [Tautonia sp. JC769]|uniref:TadE family protein n=1 Tax=Tautonia sp. JC769 TaxID=3232135 RepID=UPI0034584508